MTWSSIKISPMRIFVRICRPTRIQTRKDGDEPVFVVTQVFIFETIQWISMEFCIEG
jgi:hypothetical protein